MPNYNKSILVGHLTRDPELKYTPKGTAICKFGLAVGRKFTVDGEKREETMFIDVDAFGKQGELVSEYLTKGDPILVEGRLRLDQWETQDGQKRSRIGLVLENMQFLGGKKDKPSGGQKPRADRNQQELPAVGKETPEDDVPF